MEIAELFSDEWIQYGGDEVHYGNEPWLTNPQIIGKMKEKEITDLIENESYYN